MGFRFRKSVKIAPGVRLNFNKNSTSVSIGGKGGRYTVNSNGRKTISASIPGTGVSYVETVGGSTAKGRARKAYSPRTYKVCGVLLIVLAALAFLIGLISITVGGLVFIILGAFPLVFGVRWLRKSKHLQQKEAAPEKSAAYFRVATKEQIEK